MHHLAQVVRDYLEEYPSKSRDQIVKTILLDYPEFKAESILRQMRRIAEGSQNCSPSIKKINKKEIIQLLQRGPKSKVEISKLVDYSVQDLEAALAGMIEQGSIVKNGVGYKLTDKKESLSFPPSETRQIKFSGTRFRFAVVSDTHWNSKLCKKKELREFYQRAKKWGAEKVLHAGDIDDGEGVYRGHLYELDFIGYDNHKANIISEYPKNLETEFIIGNHDYVYVKQIGANIGQEIASRRHDLKYLGVTDAIILLNGLRVGLWHPRGGSAYAMSYKAQKYIESLVPGQKPRLLFIGHFHTRYHISYRNVDAFGCGCFQGQSILMKELGLHPAIGGHLIEIEIEKKRDGRTELKSLTPTWVPFYEENNELPI